VHAFAAAGLWVRAVFDGLQPVQLVEGEGVADAVGEELRPLVVTQIALEALHDWLAVAVIVDQFAALDAALTAVVGRRAGHGQRFAVPGPGPEQLRHGLVLEPRHGQVRVIHVGFARFDHVARLVTVTAHRFKRARHRADPGYLAQNVAQAVELVHADVDGAAAAAQQLLVAPGRLGHDLVRRPESAQGAQQRHLRFADQPFAHGPGQGAGAARLAHVLKRAEGQPFGPGGLHHPARGRNGDGQRLLGEQMLVRVERGFGYLVVQRQRSEVVHCVHHVVGDHVLVIGVDGGVHIVLKVTQIGVGRSQRIARGRIEDGRPRWRAFPAAQEHARIVFFARDQRGDAEVVHAQFAQCFVPLQMGIEYASTPHDADANHGNFLSCCLYVHRVDERLAMKGQRLFVIGD